jgi:hypothetical protein
MELAQVDPQKSSVHRTFTFNHGDALAGVSRCDSQSSNDFSISRVIVGDEMHRRTALTRDIHSSYREDDSMESSSRIT